MAFFSLGGDETGLEAIEKGEREFDGSRICISFDKRFKHPVICKRIYKCGTM